MLIMAKISHNRAYLASCLRHYAQISLRETSDTLGTLSGMPAVAVRRDKNE